MNIIKELEEIKKRAMDEGNLREERGEGIRIVVGMATCGIAAGARPVYHALIEEISKRNLQNVVVSQTGCIGICQFEPIVEVYIPGEEKITYVDMNPEKAAQIVNDIEKRMTHIDNIENDNTVQPLNALGFDKQFRIALRNCGIIDPENIDEYISFDGYKALRKVLTEMSPEHVIETIKLSSLRGRGGGGFPTGLKWEYARKNQAEKKYVVCNADEGDPGAFMDRSILEGDPHSVIEAMAICGYAIGANEGKVYIRAEYPLAIKRLKKAIKEAKAYGLIGKNCMGTGFVFDIELKYGAGSFVCGEETALIHSMEGERGAPTIKPPFPAESGYWGKPTNVNNVETFANIPAIILKGGEWFNRIGTEKSKGTKVFALAGKVKNVGLIEVPMGISLREVIFDIGKGISGDKKFKAVQTGGPSGGCLTEKDLDTPIDYDNLLVVGSMMGSGGMIVMDEDDCMVNVAKFYLDFIVEESCGKCTPCREGTKRLYELLEKITEGRGTLKDLETIEELSLIIKDASLCGLGQTASNPVLSTLHNFYDEYLAHVKDKKCPAGHCTALIQYVIDAEKCIGCTACTRACPSSAITGKIKEAHVIDQAVCDKCGICFETCKFKAISKK